MIRPAQDDAIVPVRSKALPRESSRSLRWCLVASIAVKETFLPVAGYTFAYRMIRLEPVRNAVRQFCLK
jgi:hypothetical protein